MSRKVKIGLIGLGTIGTGVARIFFEQNEPFAEEFGDTVELARIADKDISDRGVAIPEGVLTSDVQGMLTDPEIDVIIELIGGIEPARTFVLTAIENGKHVVTANKALLATHGDEILSAASDKGVDVRFEASVGGSIPILRALHESLQTSRIQSIYGILNGTTNYILTRMEREGADYGSLLKSAQEQGFAERDPTTDVTGKDSLQKLTLLLRIGFRAVISPDAIMCEGIEQITPMDISYARDYGYTIKLLATAKRHGNRIEARVAPAMIPRDSVMANCSYEYNAVEVMGDQFGTQVFYGKGAGQRPTATVVASDALDIASHIQTGAPLCRVGSMLHDTDVSTLVRPEEMMQRHYVRMEVADRAGVLEDIAGVFSSERISIATVDQKSTSESDSVPLIIMTHKASETAIKRATGKLATLLAVRPPIQHIRIEDLV
jgi:homoserine dehydrogenase